jgi:tripartite-type tricarboxylate transporter receptor subunit TctC
MTDLLGGQVDLLFEGLPVGLPHMKSGKLKALATATARRSELLPDVPTTAELGFPDINMSVWFGVVTRAGAPAAVVQDMNRRFTQALKSPKIIERFQDQGYELMAMTPQEFGAFMKAESDRWGAVIKSHQIKVE